MATVSQSCDLLLTNAHVVTMDEHFTVWNPGAVAIAAGRDCRGGRDRVATIRAAETVDCRGRVVMPGLVNAHTHAPMTLLRGLADDLRLDVWLMGYMMPVEREFVTPEFVALGTRLACAEMIRSGTTCFADMYYFEESVAEAAAAAGVRALCAQTVLKFPSPDAASFEDSLARARDFIARWKGHPLVVPAPAPHAPVHLHGRDSSRLRGAGRRVRRPAAHASRGDGVRGGTVAARARHAGGAVGDRSSGCSTRACSRRTACTWTRERCATLEEAPAPASPTTRRAT